MSLFGVILLICECFILGFFIGEDFYRRKTELMTLENKLLQKTELMTLRHNHAIEILELEHVIERLKA